MSKTIAVFQHLAVEHPGVFREFLDADDIQWQAFELDEGEAVPDLAQFDALWVMGGPMDVWQEDEYPWLVPEKAAIREAIREKNMPFLGVCLGHQLFAEALGGRVALGAQAEVGVAEIALTKAGKAQTIFADFDEVIPCLQWHSAEVVAVPNELTVLASSPACETQALGRNPSQVSIQFHIEVTNETVAEWGAVPAYKTSLEKSLGPNGLADFARQTGAHLAAFNCNAKRFYENWKTAADF
ncbi:MAG: type 1 glutamine amidotransferase [Gammaproteobacteria bacterium]